MSPTEFFFLNFRPYFWCTGTWCDFYERQLVDCELCLCRTGNQTTLCIHSALFSQPEDRMKENHKRAFEAELKFAFKLQICFSMAPLLTFYFSSSASQAFCPLCLLHLSNANKEEVMAGSGETGLCSRIKKRHCVSEGFVLLMKLLGWPLKHGSKTRN